MNYLKAVWPSLIMAGLFLIALMGFTNWWSSEIITNYMAFLPIGVITLLMAAGFYDWSVRAGSALLLHIYHDMQSSRMRNGMRC
jgi:hypothetical protein